jgi:hypothetical protein
MGDRSTTSCFFKADCFIRDPVLRRAHETGVSGEGFRKEGLVTGPVPLQPHTEKSAAPTGRKRGRASEMKPLGRRLKQRRERIVK